MKAQKCFFKDFSFPHIRLFWLSLIQWNHKSKGGQVYEKKKQIVVDSDEQQLLVRALLDKRNEFISHQLEHDDVDKLILKVIDAPRKRLFGRAIQ